MKSLSAASAALIILTAIGAAHAADLPAAPVYKAPAAIAPAYNWTGFYLTAAEDLVTKRLPTGK